ncbi:hypothetical protein HY988_04025 [Candidatus Micrarchaeota archaeon]|nr:hypothetical protein [Candidatus Micrarchaeota archaeon]
MFIAQLKAQFKEDKEPEILEKPTSMKAANAEAFIKTPEAREFVEKWRKVISPEGTPYTRRGMISFLETTYQAKSPFLSSDKEIVKAAEGLLKQMHGKDNFFAAFGGLKAKSEGLVRGIKSALGFK